MKSKRSLEPESESGPSLLKIPGIGAPVRAQVTIGIVAPGPQSI